jgi:hypothetical protein
MKENKPKNLFDHRLRREKYPVKLTKKEVEHLQWIYNRLNFVYDESDGEDYMIEFRRIIYKIRNNQKDDH